MIFSLNQLAQYALAAVSDKTFGKLQYFRSHGRFPNLENPGTFNEKIQWLKAYYRDPLLKTCADKFTVRAYVEERVGSEHLIPLLGVYESADAVDFSPFPSRFVLKASHGSGWNLLCRDKRDFDTDAARAAMRSWLKADFYKVGREWSYQGLRPRIVCEEFLSDSSGEPPWDYKLFCFHGEPRYIQVDYARFRAHERGIYSTKWERLPCKLEYALATADSPRPRTLDTMLEVARRLAEPFPFVRVDLYELGERVYFGEMTFYPGKGVERFSPPEFDRTFGQWLNIAKLAGSRSDGAA